MGLFRVDHYHYHSWLSKAPPWIEPLETKVGLLLMKMEYMMATMDQLKAAVQRNTDIDASVVTMLQGLSQQLKDAQAASDPAAVQSVIDQLDANTQALSDAVKANTPTA